jgi:hypothetical protein
MNTAAKKTARTVPVSNTAVVIAQAHALAKLLVPEALIGDSSPATEMAREAAKLMIDAALAADLNRARIENARQECKANGVEFLYGGAPYSLLPSNDPYADPSRCCPVRYTQQDSWRDYSGYLCHDERTAKWVAAWITKYLDPRDSDGNPTVNRVHEITGKGWLAVRSSYKTGD